MSDLYTWCQESLAALNLVADGTLVALSGDASFRRYYRFQTATTSYIAVDAPPATEKNHEFVSIAQLLAKADVPAPQVLAVSYDKGYMLLTDLGDALLLPVLNEASVDGYYRQALDVLVKLAKIPTASAVLPPYDRAALQTELNVMSEWFLSGLLEKPVDAQEAALLQDLSNHLINSALAEPQVFVHRDFHARNIMLCDGQLALIDFQDALYGPITYDVVSLLKDCYIVWPRSKVLECLRYFYEQSSSNLDGIEWESFVKQFDLMGLQRHIKVLGVFARLHLRDAKPNYLGDLPLVIHYVREAAGLYPETQQFSAWFESQVMPLVVKQSWYHTESLPCEQ